MPCMMPPSGPEHISWKLIHLNAGPSRLRSSRHTRTPAEKGKLFEAGRDDRRIQARAAWGPLFTRSEAAWSPTSPTSAANSSPPWPTGRGAPGPSESRSVATSRVELGKDSPGRISLFYMRGVPGLEEDLLAVATAVLRSCLEHDLRAVLAKDRS